jgi:hypothetical protein
MTVVLALLGSFAAMFALNFSLDNISLMGLTIAVGFVVVDAIVVVENIYRHVEGSMTPFEAALKGSGEIAFTVVSISVSLVAVFIPILLMGGARCCARASCGRKPVPCMGGSIAASRPASTPCWRATGAPSMWRCATGRSCSGCSCRRSPSPCHGHPDSQGLFPVPGHRGVSEVSQEASPYEMMRLQQELGEIILRIPTCRRWDRRRFHRQPP